MDENGDDAVRSALNIVAKVLESSSGPMLINTKFIDPVKFRSVSQHNLANISEAGINYNSKLATYCNKVFNDVFCCSIYISSVF